MSDAPLTWAPPRIRTWVLSYGTRRTYAVGYSHAHSRKLRREFSAARRIWWALKVDSLIGESLQ